MTASPQYPGRVSSSTPLRAVPTDDRAWLLAALADALSGGSAVLPLAPGADPADVEDVLEQPLPEGTALVIRTSGSSGVPKSVAISAEALRAGAEATHEALGGPGQWLVALPVHLIAGAQMLTRSLVAGTDPVFCDGPDGRFDPAVFMQRAESMDADRRYVSLVPVQLARLLALAEQDRAAADTLRRFAAILVGGQGVSLDLRRRSHALGLELRRSYGMTETSGGCVYDGVEIGDTQVRIREGEVQIAGTVLAEGYLGDAELTEAAFVEDRGTRWYRTGDAGELLGGMLTVTGRLDRVVISGGINVSLDQVERVVREYDGWREAVAVPFTDPEWGERPGLVRAIADETGDTLGFNDLQDRVRSELGAAAVPAWVTELEELPRLQNGKPDMLRVRERIGMLRDSFREAGRLS